MDQDIKSQLRIIFRKSEEVFGAGNSLGTPDLLPFCNSILELYKSANDIHVEFEKAFIEDFDIYKECAWELAQICMYHLRLPKYKTHLEKRLNEARSVFDWRAIPVVEHILNAYDDPWNDKEMFYGASS